MVDPAPRGCSVFGFSLRALRFFQLCGDQPVATETATTRFSYGMMFGRIGLKLPTPVAGKNSAGRVQSVCFCGTRSEILNSHCSRGAVSHWQITSMYFGAILRPTHVEKGLQRKCIRPSISCHRLFCTQGHGGAAASQLSSGQLHSNNHPRGRSRNGTCNLPGVSHF